MTLRMTLNHDAAAVFLGATVLCCWAGSLGMWRMRTPVAALHYVSLPSSLGAALLAVAVLLQVGFGQIGLKSVLIALILIGFSVAVTHATAHAVRVRAVRRAGEQTGGLLTENQRLADPLGIAALEAHANGKRSSQ